MDSVKEFYGESRRFLEVCEKPDVAGKRCAMQSSRRSPLPAPSASPSWAASATSSNSSSSPSTTSSSADLFSLFNYTILLYHLHGTSSPYLTLSLQNYCEESQALIEEEIHNQKVSKSLSGKMEGAIIDHAYIKAVNMAVAALIQNAKSLPCRLLPIS